MLKSSSKVLLCFIVSLFVTISFIDKADAVGSLSLDTILAEKTSAISNSSFADGWRWVFLVTVPSTENMLKLKFTNWDNSTSTVLVRNNMRYYSTGSTNAYSSTTAIYIGNSNVYAGGMVIDPATDLDPGTPDIQQRIVIEMKLPVGSSGSNFVTTYGISSSAPRSESTFDFVGGQVSSPSATTSNATVSNKLLWSKDFSIGGDRDARLLSTKLTYTGNATTASMSNFKLYVDNILKASASAVISNGVAFDLSTDPALLTFRNTTHNIKMTADIDGSAAGRNIMFNLASSTDISVDDAIVNGSFVNITNNGSSNSDNMIGGVQAFSVGSVSSFLNSNVVSTLVLLGQTAAPIAHFNVKAYSEPIIVDFLNFIISGTGMVTQDISNTFIKGTKLIVNGVQIGSPQDVLLDNNITFGTFTLPAQATSTIDIVTDISTPNGTSYTAGNLSVNLLASINNLYTQYTLNRFSQNHDTGQTFSIASTDVTLSVDSRTVITSTTTANANAVKIGSFKVQAGASDGQDVTSAKLNFYGTLSDNVHAHNIKLIDTTTGNQIGPTFPNVSSPSNFTITGLSIKANDSTTIDVYMDVDSSASINEDIQCDMSVKIRSQSGGVNAVLTAILGPVVTVK